MRISISSIFIFLTFILIFIIYFYRKPSTQIIRIGNDNSIYFASYGTIKKIEYLSETDQLFIAVFLSPFDIHYQYMPIKGKVLDIKHDDIGVYNLAFDLEKSKYNEKKIYTIETIHGLLYLYQIAGFLVHRIRTDIDVGEIYETGEQVGMIEFGSRVDLIIPNASRFNMKENIKVDQKINPNVLIGSYPT